MRILLTGATGFIGSHLRRALAAAGHEAVCVTRAVPPVDAPTAGCQWIQMDLAQAPSPPPATGIDAVIYLAQSRAYREFPAKAREMFAVNASSLLAVLDWARTVGVRAFVYASSANVYPPSAAPLPESTPLQPQSFYGRSKQIGEMLVSSYADYFQCTTFRFFTVYGPGQTGMLIPSLVERVRGGLPIQVQGVAGLPLSPVSVGDATRFLIAALTTRRPAPDGDVFNLGGPEALNIRRIGEQIGEALGRKPIFETLEGPEPLGWLPDATRLLAAFGSTPAVTFRDGIRQMVGTAPAGIR
jgi:UDP-glucose 4-epimerase